MARETILQEAVRAAGTYTSPPVPSSLVAVRVDNGRPVFGEAGTRVRITGVLPPEELANPANMMDLKLEHSSNGASNWTTVVAITGWSGGQTRRDGTPLEPTCSWSGTAEKAGFLRGIATINRQYAFALDLEVV